MTPPVTLQAGQEAELDAFLAGHARASMYLRSALSDGAAPDNFAVARRDGKIAGAAGQLASGMMALQAALGAGALAGAVLRATGRRLAGSLGPFEQVQAARREIGLDAADLIKDTHEDLFALALRDLRRPAVLASEQVFCRLARPGDAELLIAWRIAFRRAALNDVEGEGLLTASRSDIANLLPAGSLFVLESDRPLACCSFNARLPDIVQIGNVWTPPSLRGQGYGRAVVAGALAIAQQGGVRDAVLTTGRQNLPAQAAYRSLGFALAGDYATATLSPLQRNTGFKFC